MGVRKIPQRTCIACREEAGKRELVRLVRCPDGNIELDLSGRKAGRGAYVCRRRECFDSAFQGNRLETALRTKISAEQHRCLVEYAMTILGDATFGNS